MRKDHLIDTVENLGMRGLLVKGIHRINYATFSDSLPIVSYVVDYGGKKNND